MAIDDRCKLFVAGLPDSISEAVLRQLFEADADFIIDGESYRPRLKPKLDPEQPPPSAPAAKQKLHPRARRR